MQVSVEAGEGLERRMKVELPFEQLAEEVEKRLQQFARSARLPGFRPGKVPMRLLRQRYGEHLHHEVLKEMLESSFVEALGQQELRPAGTPRVEPDVDLDAKRVGFTATFEVLPEFDLAPVAGQSVKRPVSEVTDSDLEKMIQRLLEQRKTWQVVERPSQSGDQLTISFAGTVDGESFEGGASSGFRTELGSGRMIPGFEDGLIGAAAGETRVLDLAFPEGYHAEHLAGKPVRFEVTVDAVAESVLPEMDAEFLSAFGVDDGDVERFKSDVRSNMERELKDRLRARTKERVMDILLEANRIEVPASLVQGEARSMAQQMRKMVGGGDLSMPSELFASSAHRRVALGLIMGKVIQENGIKADAERVREAVEQMAATYEQPQEVIDYYYGEASRLQQIETMVLEDQVVELMLEQLDVQDEPVSFEDLTDSQTGA